jgi:arsenite-transporting ATPase
MILVARPERSALEEAARTSAELLPLGVTHQRLVINAVFEAKSEDPVALALELRGCEALTAMPPALQGLPREILPLRPTALLGVDELRLIDTPVVAPPLAAVLASDEVGLAPLVDELAESRCGVVLTMGKGGVGKTTIAAAIAVELARRGLRVRLSTTDPASHVSDAVEAPPSGLTVSRIDPAAETRAYTAEVLSTLGSQLDDKGRALLEEDLRSPCTEEVAVFRAFARTVAEGSEGVVVLDTAPTGHTILLLDAAESYHREVLRQGSRMPESVRQLLPRLGDPKYTRVLLVTLPEATPVHEARFLQEDLGRAGITPFAWVVNQSLQPLTTHDPVLAARRAAEAPYLDEVRTLTERMAVVGWAPEVPRGANGLARLTHRFPKPTSLRERPNMRMPR